MLKLLLAVNHRMRSNDHKKNVTVVSQKMHKVA